MGQLILEGLNVSLIGMTITISSLIALTLIIVVMTGIIGIKFKKPPLPATTGAPIPASTAADGFSPTVLQIQPDSLKSTTGDAGEIPGGELIAVFAAAIAQVTGADASSIRVVSFRKTGRGTPVWNARGRNDYLSGKL